MQGHRQSGPRDPDCVPSFTAASPVQGFRGDELYMRPWPSLVGRRFGGSILLMFEAAVPLGVMHAYSSDIVLNPGDDYIYAEGGSRLNVDPTHLSAACAQAPFLLSAVRS